MARRRRASNDPMALWFAQARLAQELVFTGVQASMVVSSRLTTMAAEGGSPTAAGRRDAERMVTEKLFAAYDGATAASRATARHAFAGTLHTPAAALNIAEAATRPTRRAVRANARRLTVPPPLRG